MPKLPISVACAAVLALAAAGPARGEVLVNESPEINFAAFVPCANNGAGEVVLLTGPLHTMVTSTVNANHVSGMTRFQPQGLSGTGLITGDTYQGTGVTQNMFDSSLVNGQFSQTFVNNFRIVGHGPGNNYMIHENYHLTINANGDVSTFHDNFSADCK